MTATIGYLNDSTIVSEDRNSLREEKVRGNVRMYSDPSAESLKYETIMAAARNPSFLRMLEKKVS